MLIRLPINIWTKLLTKANIKQIALVENESPSEQGVLSLETLTLVRPMKQGKFSALDGEASMPLG